MYLSEITLYQRRYQLVSVVEEKVVELVKLLQTPFLVACHIIGLPREASRVYAVAEGGHCRGR